MRKDYKKVADRLKALREAQQEAEEKERIINKLLSKEEVEKALLGAYKLLGLTKEDYLSPRDLADLLEDLEKDLRVRSLRVLRRIEEGFDEKSKCNEYLLSFMVEWVGEWLEERVEGEDEDEYEE